MHTQPTNYVIITPEENNQLAQRFIELIEICDSFDQLTKIALILDSLYPPNHPKHKSLFTACEATAKHLRGNPNIGAVEVK